MKRFNTWYASSKIIDAIGILGDTIYEREILRLALGRYMKIYSKKNTNHKVNIPLSFSDVSGVMGRKKYFDSIASLKQRSVIEYTSKKGRKGYQEVSMITRKVVDIIKAKKFTTDGLLTSDSIEWI
jgi:hypothetical protein